MPTLLASGGLDSITLMYGLIKHPQMYGIPHGEPFYSFLVDFGQVSYKQSLRIVRDFHRRLSQPVENVIEVSVCIPLHPKLAENPMFNAKAKPNRMRDPVDDDYINGRNSILFTQALCFAAARGQNVWTGLHAENERGFKNDRTREFLNALDAVNLAGAFKDGEAPLVIAPFLDFNMTKAAVAEYAYSLGVPVEETASCPYIPTCGICDCCRFREDALGYGKILHLERGGK